MDTGKIVGYVLSLIGLAIIVFSKKISALSILSFFGAKSMVYTILGAVILVVAGIALVMMPDKIGNIKHAAAEVPIYEGEGKKRKIVGYHRAK